VGIETQTAIVLAAHRSNAPQFEKRAQYYNCRREKYRDSEPMFDYRAL